MAGKSGKVIASFCNIQSNADVNPIGCFQMPPRLQVSPALDDALEMKIIGEGSTVIFLGLGAGLTWGAVVSDFGSQSKENLGIQELSN
jgi:hypothetical protein